MNNEPVTQAPNMLCRYCHDAQSFVNKDQKLVRCAEPSGATSNPTGRCIQASVTMMKKPESHDPMKIITAASRWSFGPNRLSPYKNIPRNDDSRKKANTPSIARDVAITPPE